MMPTHPLRHLISSSHVTTSGYSADPAAGHSLSAEPPPGRKSHRCTPSRNQGHMGGGSLPALLVAMGAAGCAAVRLPPR